MVGVAYGSVYYKRQALRLNDHGFMMVHVFGRDFDELQTKFVSFMTSIIIVHVDDCRHIRSSRPRVKPVDMDKTLYKEILEYAKIKTSEKIADCRLAFEKNQKNKSRFINKKDEAKLKQLCTGNRWTYLLKPDIQECKQLIKLKDIISIARNKSKCCKPDNVDQTIHRIILEYAYYKTGKNIPENWTMARLRYFKDDGKEKTFHKMLFEWWKKNKKYGFANMKRNNMLKMLTYFIEVEPNMQKCIERIYLKYIMSIARKHKCLLGGTWWKESKFCKPDNLDQTIYNEIIQYAYCKTGENIPHTWTMARFRWFEDDGKEIRLYAFSGLNRKPYHKMPFEWWIKEYRKKPFDNKYRDIVVVNAADQNLGQNMILTLFDVLKPDMHKELYELGECIFNGEDQSVKSVIEAKDRMDLGTLDYEEFCKPVVEKKRIWRQDYEKALTNKPNKVTNIKSGFEKRKHETLKGCTETFLQNNRERLKQAHCAEDNGLTTALAIMLGHKDMRFTDTKVDIVALDKNNMDGKPFCEVCDKKVRFFSVLPFVLYQ